MMTGQQCGAIGEVGRWSGLRRDLCMVEFYKCVECNCG